MDSGLFVSVFILFKLEWGFIRGYSGWRLWGGGWKLRVDMILDSWMVYGKVAFMGRGYGGGGGGGDV